MGPRSGGDLLQGMLDMLVLNVLTAGPLHGYAIARRIAERSDARLQVPQGSLYPALHRLENRGWLSASWTTTDSGRKAKVYRLTAKGRQQLAREVADWERLSEGVRLLLAPAG